MADKSAQVVSADVSFDSSIDFTMKRVVFEMDDQRDVDQLSDGVVRVRRYPGVSSAIGQGSNGLGGVIGVGGDGVMPGGVDYFGYRYEVSEGRMQVTNEVREKEVTGYLTLQGGTEVEFPYPVVHSLTFEKEGAYYTATGSEANPLFRYDIQNQKLIVSRPVFGKVRYRYFTNYVVMRYFPINSASEEAFYNVLPENYGQALAFPVVGSQDDLGSTITYQIQPPPAVQAEYELYRVVSEAVISSSDIWEKPAGYPDSLNFPGVTSGPSSIPAKDARILVERVHEIAYLRLGNYQSENASMGSLGSVSTNSVAGLDALDNTGRVILGIEKSTRTLTDFVKRSAATASGLRASVRNVVYDVPWAAPFENFKPTTILSVYTVKSNQVTQNNYTPVTYKRAIKVKAAKAPAVDSQRASSSGINQFDIDLQQYRVNMLLRQAYDAVDWAAVRRNVKARYGVPDSCETLAFDPSVPST